MKRSTIWRWRWNSSFIALVGTGALAALELRSVACPAAGGDSLRDNRTAAAAKPPRQQLQELRIEPLLEFESAPTSPLIVLRRIAGVNQFRLHLHVCACRPLVSGIRDGRQVPDEFPLDGGVLGFLPEIEPFVGISRQVV